LFSVVQKATRSSGGAIIHDKLHACYFCDKLVTNIWRHYDNVHSKEHSVKSINALRNDNPVRQKEIARLRVLGDYHHNLNVLCAKHGELIVVRRLRLAEVSYSDFLSCSACKGFFIRHELWRHCKSCPFVQTDREINRCQKYGMILLAPVVYSRARR